MKKLRTSFNEIKEGYLSGKVDESFAAYWLANAIFIWCVFTIIYAISAIIHIFYETAGVCMIVISIILLFVFLSDKHAYKFIWDKKNIGYCYLVAWVLALRVEDAKIMYCSIACEGGGQTAHAVVVKNNCVYDTNIRMHYDFDEYIKIYHAEVYQIFEEEVYRKRSFFDDVKQGFMDWCAERDVYCDPQ